MYSNDLNNAYLYESERRKDEMRDALESQRIHEVGKKRARTVFSPLNIAGFLVVLLFVIHYL